VCVCGVFFWLVGITSSDEKAKDLKQRAKFDEVINYKKVDDLHQTLLKVAPFGIDIVFDTVGGDFLGMSKTKEIFF
jgi:NADPH-dependent curcumin reductase CurA